MSAQFQSVPTIDVAALWTSHRDDAQDALVPQFKSSLQTCGGLVVTGFPDADDLARLAAEMLGFFDLGVGQKMKVATRETSPDSPNIYRGYVSLLESQDFARSEFFDIGPVQPERGPDIVGMPILEELSQWPEPLPSAGWRLRMRAWYELMRDLSKRLLSVIAVALNVDATALIRLFRNDNSTLRLLNYPARRTEGAPLATGEGGLPLATDRHTDGSGLSLLWQDQPGLQAQGPDGRWFDIPARADAVSIHLGDVLAMVTEGRIPPTPHRVIEQPGGRRSIGFFLEPALMAPMSPLSENPVSGDPLQTYGAQLLRRLRSYPSMAAFIPEIG